MPLGRHFPRVSGVRKYGIEGGVTRRRLLYSVPANADDVNRTVLRHLLENFLTWIYRMNRILEDIQ